MNVTAKTTVSLRIEPKLLQDVEHIAEKEERTKSAVMLRLIRLGVESWKRKAAK
jgi:predicted transcriptional regulator